MLAFNTNTEADADEVVGWPPRRVQLEQIDAGRTDHQCRDRYRDHGTGLPAALSSRESIEPAITTATDAETHELMALACPSR